MVLIHHDPVVVLSSGVTATARVLPVLSDTTVSGGNVAALLSVLTQAWI
jgi:hypothetical protein